MVWQEKLREREIDWEEHEQVNEGLLTGRYLLEAQEYSNSHEEMLSENHRNFISLSSSSSQQKKLIQQWKIAGIIGVISLIASIATWQWKLALYSAELVKEETKKSINARNESNTIIRSLPQNGGVVDYSKISENMQHFINKNNKNFNDKTLYSYALLMQQSGNLDEAEKSLLEFKKLTIKEKTFYLKNLARFVTYFRRDYDWAERIYHDILEINPNNPNEIGGFARFMHNISGKHDEAEKLYRLALKLDPKHEANLLNFAIFHHVIRKNYNQAGIFYQQFIDINPVNSTGLGNYAQLKLAKGNYSEGKELLDKAFETNKGRSQILDLELWFYRFAHFSQSYPEAQSKIIDLLRKNIRSKNWDFSINIIEADKKNHLKIPLLKIIADVISGKLSYHYLMPIVDQDRIKTFHSAVTSKHSNDFKKLFSIASNIKNIVKNHSTMVNSYLNSNDKNSNHYNYFLILNEINKKILTKLMNYI